MRQECRGDALPGGITLVTAAGVGLRVLHVQVSHMNMKAIDTGEAINILERKREQQTEEEQSSRWMTRASSSSTKAYLYPCNVVFVLMDGS